MFAGPAFLFQLVTLPVEFRRLRGALMAVAGPRRGSWQDERRSAPAVEKVLRRGRWTYIAAPAASVCCSSSS
jgi:Zn-dependent membrane protease YugP